MRKTAAFIGAALFIFSSFSSLPAQAASRTSAEVSTYATVLRKINPRLAQWQSRDLAIHVLSSAARWNLDANLLIALVTVESRWRPAARSRVGALGLGQLMPGTARTLGVNPHNANSNLSGCAHYLSAMIEKYENRPNGYQLAFAAYNAGPKAVDRYHGVPPFNETQHYVVRVMRMWQHFTKIVRLPVIEAQVTTAAAGATSDWYTKFSPSEGPAEK